MGVEIEWVRYDRESGDPIETGVFDVDGDGMLAAPIRLPAGDYWLKLPFAGGTQPATFPRPKIIARLPIPPDGSLLAAHDELTMASRDFNSAIRGAFDPIVAWLARRLGSSGERSN